MTVATKMTVIFMLLTVRGIHKYLDSNRKFASDRKNKNKSGRGMNNFVLDCSSYYRILTPQTSIRSKCFMVVVDDALKCLKL